MNLRQNYHQFMRQLVDKKWLSKYENAVVLGERFIGKYYIVIFESESEE